MKPLKMIVFDVVCMNTWMKELTIEMKNRFNELLSSVKRPGIPELMGWLAGSDFYTAPASTRYHGACDGGLLLHSLTVCTALQGIIKDYGLNVKPESAIMCGLLHDVCKVRFYKTSTRNVKNAAGVWEQKPYYEIDDQFPMSHGAKSVYIINEFTRLTVEEAMAIHWHMGAWNATEYGDRSALSAAMEKYPLTLALQMADQMATFWEKK